MPRALLLAIVWLLVAAAAAQAGGQSFAVRLRIREAARVDSSPAALGDAAAATLATPGRAATPGAASAGTESAGAALLAFSVPAGAHALLLGPDALRLAAAAPEGWPVVTLLLQ
jgi:hypothetical protein